MSTSDRPRCVTYATIVGAVLVELRFRTDSRQQDFADAVGVAQTTWSRIERGERDLLVEQLVALGRALYLPPQFVLDVAAVITRRLVRDGVKVLWLRDELTPAVAAGSEVLGVADLADTARTVMAKGRFSKELLARAFRRIAAQTPDKPVSVAEALHDALPHAPGIGRRVRPKR